MSEEDDNFFEDIDDIPEVEFIPPSPALKEKAGSGGIPDHLVERAQTHINDNKVDFVPIAEKYIKDIRSILKKLKGQTSHGKKKSLMQDVISCIMQLKAHGGMFNYPVITNISNYILRFVEGNDNINEDLYKIIEAHNETIELITSQQVKLENDERAIALTNELRGVIERYQKKYS